MEGSTKVLVALIEAAGRIVASPDASAGAVCEAKDFLKEMFDRHTPSKALERKRRWAKMQRGGE